MKYNVVFKFIAILLCAASLLGIIGSAGFMLTLAELDLYNKTVDQVRQERIDSDAQSLASNVALSYASTTLGGCPDQFVKETQGYHWFYYNYDPSKYGYALLDAKGNVLETFGTPTENAVTYSYPVSGQYMHMVALETQSEKDAREMEKTAGYYQNTTSSEATVYNAIPTHGAIVGYAMFYNALDGSIIWSASDSQGVGFLYSDQNGCVNFGTFREQNLSDPGVVSGALFLDREGNLLYEAVNPDGVGELLSDEYRNLNFTAFPPEDTLEKSPVYRASLFDRNSQRIYSVYSAEPIGWFYYNEEGYAVFETCFHSDPLPYTEEGTLQPGIVHGITLTGEGDEALYDIHSSGGIGAIFYGDNGEFVFNSIYPAFAPAAETDLEALPAPEGPTEETASTEVTETAEASEATEATEETTVQTTEESSEATEEPTQAPTEETKESKKEKSSASDIPEETKETKKKSKKTSSVQETTPETTPVTTVPETEPPVSTEATVPPTEAEETVAVTEVNGKSIDEFEQHLEVYYDSTLGEDVWISYVYTPMPEYTLELYLAPGALDYEWEYDVLRLVRAFSSYLLPALGACLLVFAIFAVYLCCAAGHKPRQEEIRAGGLNRISLDLYFGLTIGGMVLMVGLANFLIEELIQKDLLVCVSLFGIAGLLVCLLTVAFFFALAAQVKTPGGFWWRNTLTMRCILLFVRFCVWLEKFLRTKFFPWLGRVFKLLWTWLAQLILWCYRILEKSALWICARLGRFFRWLGSGINRFLSLLPLTWQWMLGGFTIMLLVVLTFATNGEGFMVLLCLGGSIAIILYAAHCFGVLFESTKRMSKGDLDTKVEDKLMAGCFKDFAGDLNDLADVAVVAAQKQLKSERMKTELITNVSHDIKTPLTSIINYVDLLQKPHTDNEQAQYLEVLDRQSQRLKKLIDDLMDMSKASTGNMTVEVTKVDAVESVNQALGEFADKLDRVGLIPVFRHTDDYVPMIADGKLVWRVLSNLLNNAVKYAMPGTRLYIDLMQLEGKVVISLKNISRDELNVDAEELMERFVRGDDSRNTEGSGLGLNIAKSLMELQKGQLQLLVDGDLFKVTLIFPGA